MLVAKLGRMSPIEEWRLCDVKIPYLTEFTLINPVRLSEKINKETKVYLNNKIEAKTKIYAPRSNRSEIYHWWFSLLFFNQKARNRVIWLQILGHCIVIWLLIKSMLIILVTLDRNRSTGQHHCTILLSCPLGWNW